MRNTRIRIRQAIYPSKLKYLSVGWQFTNTAKWNQPPTTSDMFVMEIKSLCRVMGFVPEVRVHSCLLGMQIPESNSKLPLPRERNPLVQHPSVKQLSVSLLFPKIEPIFLAHSWHLVFTPVDPLPLHHTVASLCTGSLARGLVLPSCANTALFI